MKENVCKICNGNDYIFDPKEGTYHQCPLCTHLGKLYEPQEVENETRTETIQTHSRESIWIRGWVWNTTN